MVRTSAQSLAASSNAVTSGTWRHSPDGLQAADQNHPGHHSPRPACPSTLVCNCRRWPCRCTRDHGHPPDRTCEALAALYGCQVLEACALPGSDLTAERLAPMVERLAGSRLHQGDKTAICVSGMQDVLLDLHDVCQQWRLLHLSAGPAITRDDRAARFFAILATGSATHPPRFQDRAQAGSGKAGPGCCWRVPSTCWPGVTICGFH